VVPVVTVVLVKVPDVVVVDKVDVVYLHESHSTGHVSLTTSP